MAKKQPWTVVMFCNSRVDSFYAAYLDDAKDADDAVRKAFDELKQMDNIFGTKTNYRRVVALLAVPEKLAFFNVNLIPVHLQIKE